LISGACVVAKPCACTTYQKAGGENTAPALRMLQLLNCTV
jgi:hypothetical protein